MLGSLGPPFSFDAAEDVAGASGTAPCLCSGRMAPDYAVDSDLVLLAASDAHEADRMADALIGTGPFAFIFARDAVSAMSYAVSTDPSRVIVALAGPEGPRLARDVRAAKPERDTRVVL